ncbi:MAG: branched-chain amino acid transporter permease [Marmoricola sp.]|nr:branched-chain amino acid transporter permease [Marmoricola sp.]
MSTTKSNDTGALRPALRTAGALAVVVALLLVPAFTTQDVVFNVGSAVCAIVLALSFNIIFGYGGVVSFGHASLFATGGYVAGIALNNGHGFWAAMAAAGVVGAVVGALFALVALRASGIYFAIITLAMGQIVFVVAEQWDDVTGGISGLSGVGVDSVSLGFTTVSLPDADAYYRLVVVMGVLFVGAMWLLSKTRFTRLLRATRDDDVRVAALGLNVYRWRFVAFVWSSLFAALAGGLYAPLGGLVYPELARWDASAEPILATLLGGSGSFWGPVVGATVFALIDFFARDLNSLRVIITGAILLLVLLAAPGGLTSIRERVRRHRGKGQPATDTEKDVTAAVGGTDV